MFRAAENSEAFTEKQIVANQKGFFFIHKDQLEEAEKEFEKAAYLSPHIKFQLIQGVLMKANGKKKEANKMLRELGIKDKP